jgi:LysR family glycine cleavage system transcriptional activator
VQLFQRKARGLAITDDGRKLLPQVGGAIEALRAATAAFDAGPTEHLLSIATSVSIAQWVLAPNLDRFLAQHPGLRIRLLSTIWPDQFKAWLADVEIRFGTEKQVGAGADRLSPDSLIAVASQTPQSRLEEQTLIEAVGVSVGWKEWAEINGFRQDMNPTIFVDSYGLALELARQGQGVALISSMLAATALACGDVVQVHPGKIDSPDGYFLAAGETTQAQAFAQWLRELAGGG